MRSNEAVTSSGSGALRTNPDGMKLDNENIHDLPGSVTIIHKDEELPYQVGNKFGAITMGGTSPQVDKQGMEIMGESGIGATGRDING